MAHPTDQALHLTVGRQIAERLAFKVDQLISDPNPRTAGYIEALLDVQTLMNGGEQLPLPVPTQKR